MLDRQRDTHALQKAGFAGLVAEIHGCRSCARLVEWREESAADPPRRFQGEDYWARPVAGFGDPGARVAVVGLAPAAHGANRTGRMFTGDRSGDWLYAALHRAGFASQPGSERRDDGLRLRDAYVTAVVRCAPPANRPTPAERDGCLPYLERELALLERCRTIVALGGFGWDGSLRAIQFAAAKALDQAEEIFPKINAVYQRRRDMVVDLLNANGWDIKKPKATIYIWAPVPAKFAGSSAGKEAHR